MPLVFPQPPISSATAHRLAAFFAFSYVGSLYISKHARLSFNKKVADIPDGQERTKEASERWRDDPDVIRARLTAVSISTVVSCGVVFVLLQKLVEEAIGQSPQNLHISRESAIARMGFTLTFREFYPADILLPCLTAPVLFLGPLFALYLASELPGQARWSLEASLAPVVATWQGWRNYIIGPVTEELVFRACTIAVYHLAGASRTKIIFLSPLTFGAAHLHHAWDTYNRYGRTSAAAKRALLTALFQLGYTTIFGFHCVYLFLRTGSIIPPILSHVFCNIMGVPMYGQHVTYFPQRRRLIQLAYILGIFGYVWTMRHWTLAHDSMYWPRERAWEAMF